MNAGPSALSLSVSWRMLMAAFIGARPEATLRTHTHTHLHEDSLPTVSASAVTTSAHGVGIGSETLLQFPWHLE